jgi:hypothetical protein
MLGPFHKIEGFYPENIYTFSFLTSCPNRPPGDQFGNAVTSTGAEIGYNKRFLSPCKVVKA